jgi:hypothetical protein
LIPALEQPDGTAYAFLAIVPLLHRAMYSLRKLPEARKLAGEIGDINHACQILGYCSSFFLSRETGFVIAAFQYWLRGQAIQRPRGALGRKRDCDGRSRA